MNMGARAQLGIAGVLRPGETASSLQFSKPIMRYQDTLLDVRTARFIEPYAPEPIEPEVTEIIERLHPAVDDDDFEPEPLPPVPARGSGTYQAVTIYPRYR